MRMVVFDMAGTTVDEANVVYRTMQEALAAAGLSLTLSEVIALGAGKEKRAALGEILGAHASVATPPLETVFRAFEGRLDAAYATLAVRPMAGAEAVMGALRAAGVRVVLNTGYLRRVAEGLVARLGWAAGETFDLLVTADDVGVSRPAPAMIALAMARLGVRDPREVVKVGDTVADVLEGRNAGCGLCVAVTTGAQGREALAHAAPDAILDALADLLPLLGLSAG